jgi:hypothetical protein
MTFLLARADQIHQEDQSPVGNFNQPEAPKRLGQITGAVIRDQNSPARFGDTYHLAERQEANLRRHVVEDETRHRDVERAVIERYRPRVAVLNLDAVCNPLDLNFNK